MIYDFTWDDQGDLGVWVKPADGSAEVLVEASIRVQEDDEEGDKPTGEYVLASRIPLDGYIRVIAPDGLVRGGPGARKFVERLARIEREGKQVPVNERQERLLLGLGGAS